MKSYLQTALCFALLLTIALISDVTNAALKSPTQELVGFKNGNNIEITNLYGRVTYFCRAANGTSYRVSHSCNGFLANPGTHDVLVARATLDADSVSLTATHEDGSTQKKSSKFDGKKSETKSRFNLIIRSLLQKPLLAGGTNNIDYTFEKKKKSVLKGSFKANVTVAEERSCRDRTVFTHNSNHCDSIASGCDHYYYLENNCQY